MDIRKLIKKPLITEKASLLKEKDNKYVFMVEKTASKGQIKQAVEELFKVKVEGVHTAIIPGKLHRLGAHAGYRPDWKKATVKVRKGQEIKLVEEV
ncbi:MAG TPA: 50S ribosomal protein L23 [Elusimicrobia bacterium]|nr:MAG: 50S ribosomal protein L23 [Elusimicrobia bacterium RIFOXYA12_FULL_49_49]OGS06128.1 MAG: 50S ribosomal protein L23 [Elusimicrobia bacterium RIFOXYA1_FULL_47_7]OGS09457.1 MAG: 50S ribosomal protein L23 [Elusimicrobia bacterium RIFOXYB1_FULL_48_9]OGS14590.1 MAG: 50S ribosomal protein L23 [Elusimicrobia bacterium RIFOXYA2_FULL_47_53]OGS25756.1 MAG: 50S ribosomal protein L23 [Elusimicrobia bacterium RIFOXYB12_FULL_50_12]OGS31681.1 MAG: 50S ribosomal protein L23 [Elusimicrobia bacterium RIFO